MKATELRIGNYVWYGDGELKIDINVLYDIKVYNALGTKPIPLTEEWLLKFGFEKRGYVKFLGNAYQRFVLGRNGIYSINEIAYIYEVCDHDLCEIRYVHQLQNLYFALTGEELIESTNK